MDVLVRKAKEKNAPLSIVKPEDYFTDTRLNSQGMSLCLKETGEWTKTSLAGIHQLENFALAIKACELFAGKKLPQSSVIQGLSSVQWKGRFERLSENPLIYYDVAHNPAGVRRLKELVLSLYPDKPLTLVVGMLGDKETHEIVDILLPYARTCYLSPVKSHRSMTWDALIELSATRPQTRVLSGICDALINALDSTPKDGIILIYGSHYIAPDVYHTIDREINS